MKILLASVISKTNEIKDNKDKIINLIKKYSNQVDMILLGEAFLQSFYALNFNYERDINIAVDINSKIIKEIKEAARDNNVAVSLCGDLWFDENIDEINSLMPNIVLWPVYTDFSPIEWNTTGKIEYCIQAKRACKKVLYVNSVSLDQNGSDIAKGGSAFFNNGIIEQESPSGSESELLVVV